MSRRNFYLRCVSALALAGAASAAQAADDSKTRSSSVSELVVTAERRVENLQTTAISASVLDQKTLEAKGVTNLTTLQFAAPGVQISDYGSANTFNIRGIGQSAVPIDLPSGVVIYRDGVPTLTGYFQNAPYYDIASVEVLRGPQGTFVGKSAAAGAVFIRTRDPELGHYGGSVMAGAGDHGFLETTDVANLPIGDTLAVRIAYHGEYRNTLYDSLRTDPLPGGANAGGPFAGDDRRKLNSIRLGVKWKPNDNFDALFKVDYDYLHFGCHCTTGFIPTTGVEEDMRNPVVNGHNMYIDRGVRSSLNLNYNLGDGYTIKSLTGYSFVKTRADWDINGSNPAPDGFRSGGQFTNYSQEFDILTPQDRRFRFTGGVFLQKYINRIPQFPQPGFAIFTDNTTTPLLSFSWKRNDHDVGIFGQAAYDLTKDLELQVGVRWDHYWFDQVTNAILFPGVLNIPFNQPVGGVLASLNEHEVDWKVNLNYHLSETQFVYGLISRGHTPGSINTVSAATNPGVLDAYNPMVVINYEAGLKSRLFDDHLRTQLAVYYQTFKDYQAGFAFAGGPGIPQLATVSEFRSAQTRSTIWGVELGGQGAWGDWTLDFGAAYSKSKLGSFGLINNIFAPVFGGPTAVDLAGTTTPFAPEITGNVGIAYTYRLDSVANGATLTPRVDVAYKSKSYSDLFHNRATLLPSTTLVNANLRYTQGPWWGELWATNLFDKTYPSAKQNVTGAAGIIQGIVYMGNPRQFGLRIGREF
jgi:iron complex outermembrane receptor protein